MVVEEVSLGGNTTDLGPKLLSEWGLFEEPLNTLQPVAGVFPYELNSPLFSDYALSLIHI